MGKRIHDKSYSFRGFYPEHSLENMARLLENERFTEEINSRTPRLSNVIRMAVAIGIERLEQEYGIKPEKTDAKDSD